MLRHLPRGLPVTTEGQDSGSVFNVSPQSMASKARTQMRGLSRVERGRALPGGHCGAHVSGSPWSPSLAGESVCTVWQETTRLCIQRDRGFRVGSAMFWLCDLGQDIQMCPSFSFLNYKMREWYSLWRAAWKAKRVCRNKCPIWAWHIVGFGGYWFPSSTHC